MLADIDLFSLSSSVHRTLSSDGDWALIRSRPPQLTYQEAIGLLTFMSTQVYSVFKGQLHTQKFRVLRLGADSRMQLDLPIKFGMLIGWPEFSGSAHFLCALAAVDDCH